MDLAFEYRSLSWCMPNRTLVNPNLDSDFTSGTVHDPSMNMIHRVGRQASSSFLVRSSARSGGFPV